MSKDKDADAIMEATYQLPEAPASATIKFWVDDFSVMLTMRGQKVSGIVEQLEYILDTAKKKDWKSTWQANEQPPAPTPQAPAPPPQPQVVPVTPPAPVGAVPTCPVHNRAMKLFDGKFGKFYKCTAKLGEGVWCDQKQNA